MGAQGARIVTPAMKPKHGTDILRLMSVDTTGAGDTFNAALAVGLSEKMALPDAIRFANAAAALCVTKPGAADSAPYRAEVDALLTR